MIVMSKLTFTKDKLKIYIEFFLSWILILIRTFSQNYKE